MIIVTIVILLICITCGYFVSRDLIRRYCRRDR